MEISTPIPFIDKIKEKIEKKMFLKYYQHSHSKYQEYLYNNDWINIDEFGFSFKLHLENIKRNYLNDNSFLMIENITNNKLEKIEILVTAESVFEKYCQYIYVDNLLVDTKPNTYILNQIPFQELEFYDDNIIKKYDTLTIELISINGTQINKEIHIRKPMYITFLNDTWERKWEINWNLRYIDKGKQKLKHYIYNRIVNNNLEDLEIYRMNFIHPRKFIKSLTYNFLAMKYILNTLFWILIWSNKIIEDEDGYYKVK